MCKIVVAPETEQSTICDKIRMYSHLLDLSVDVEQADDGCFGSGSCDILMIEKGCSPDSESGILELSAMDTHVVIVSGDAESASMGSRLCTLPANWTIRDFYVLSLHRLLCQRQPHQQTLVRYQYRASGAHPGGHIHHQKRIRRRS